MASRMSREVVSPISPTGSVDFHAPSGRCRTKPWSNWTGPPKKTGWPARIVSASGISTCRKSASSVTSIGRFTTMPSAPRSLCSQMKVRVREKFGSAIAGMAMRKWLVRLIVCIGHRSRILIPGEVWLKSPPEGSGERYDRAEAARGGLFGDDLVGAREGPRARDVQDVRVHPDVVRETVERRGEAHDADRGLVQHLVAGGAVDLDRF